MKKPLPYFIVLARKAQEISSKEVENPLQLRTLHGLMVFQMTHCNLEIRYPL